jgi:hypothetical protein
LSSSQSRYPLQTVIDGDSVVILTKGQADTINDIFESQKKKIADNKIELRLKDSIIKRRDSLLRYHAGYYSDYKTLKEEYTDLLILSTYTEQWITNRAKESAWIYYSYDSNWIEAVDLSEYKVRKNDATGDIFFYRADTCPPEDKKKNDYPKRGWEKEVVLPHRPKINKL